MISDDTFFLSQLDNSFDKSNAHLASAMQGFLQGGITMQIKLWWWIKTVRACTPLNCYCISSQKPS
tara:strand:- start:798 stop:995 length:198 start_codon:yes stop_codon:yes gene_type:complete